MMYEHEIGRDGDACSLCEKSGVRHKRGRDALIVSLHICFSNVRNHDHPLSERFSTPAVH